MIKDDNIKDDILKDDVLKDDNIKDDILKDDNKKDDALLLVAECLPFEVPKGKEAHSETIPDLAFHNKEDVDGITEKLHCHSRVLGVVANVLPTSKAPKEG